MSHGDLHIKHFLIELAEKQFKLAIAVAAHTHKHPDKPKFSYLSAFSSGKHVLAKKDLELTALNERLASTALEHSTTYLMAVQLDSTLEAIYGSKRFTHKDDSIRNASCIARLIRNAFAHNPLSPVWKIHRQFKNKTFAIPGVIEIDTSRLANGQAVVRMHYGSPLALLRFSEFVRLRLLPGPSGNLPVVAQPAQTKP